MGNSKYAYLANQHIVMVRSKHLSSRIAHVRLVSHGDEWYFKVNHCVKMHVWQWFGKGHMATKMSECMVACTINITTWQRTHSEGERSFGRVLRATMQQFLACHTFHSMHQLPNEMGEWRAVGMAIGHFSPIFILVSFNFESSIKKTT